MRRKIFDGGDLVIWHKKKGTEGGLLVYGRDLIIEVKGKDIAKSTKTLTIYLDAKNPMWYEIQMYSIFEKIKRKLKGI